MNKNQAEISVNVKIFDFLSISENFESHQNWQVLFPIWDVFFLSTSLSVN
jgi:hypothetical protein